MVGFRCHHHQRNIQYFIGCTTLIITFFTLFHLLRHAIVPDSDSLGLKLELGLASDVFTTREKNIKLYTNWLYDISNSLSCKSFHVSRDIEECKVKVCIGSDWKFPIR